jgi:hypothetical protein
MAPITYTVATAHQEHRRMARLAVMDELVDISEEADAYRKTPRSYRRAEES